MDSIKIHMVQTHVPIETNQLRKTDWPSKAIRQCCNGARGMVP